MSAGKGVAQRVARLKAQVEQLARRQVVAIVLELAEAPAGTEALPDGRCVLLGLGDGPSRHAVLTALQAGEPVPATTLLLEYRATASAFIADAAGRCRPTTPSCSPRRPAVKGSHRPPSAPCWRTRLSTRRAASDGRCDGWCSARAASICGRRWRAPWRCRGGPRRGGWPMRTVQRA